MPTHSSTPSTTVLPVFSQKYQLDTDGPVRSKRFVADTENRSDFFRSFQFGVAGKRFADIIALISALEKCVIISDPPEPTDRPFSSDDYSPVLTDVVAKRDELARQAKLTGVSTRSDPSYNDFITTATLCQAMLASEEKAYKENQAQCLIDYNASSFLTSALRSMVSDQFWAAATGYSPAVKAAFNASNPYKLYYELMMFASSSASSHLCQQFSHTAQAFFHPQALQPKRAGELAKTVKEMPFIAKEFIHHLSQVTANTIIGPDGVSTTTPILSADVQDQLVQKLEHYQVFLIFQAQTDIGDFMQTFAAAPAATQATLMPTKLKDVDQRLAQLRTAAAMSTTIPSSEQKKTINNVTTPKNSTYDPLRFDASTLKGKAKKAKINELTKLLADTKVKAKDSEERRKITPAYDATKKYPRQEKFTKRVNAIQVCIDELK